MGQSNLELCSFFEKDLLNDLYFNKMYVYASTLRRSFIKKIWKNQVTRDQLYLMFRGDLSSLVWDKTMLTRRYYFN